MAMKLITGYTGEKHITPADDAMLYKALFGNEDYVLHTGGQLAATIQSATEIRIADGELIMQGRFARNASGYETIAISNGSQGMNRNDLIVARYTKDANTAVEAIVLAVITGTATTGTAVDPAYNTGDIDNGETRDFPLYRVRLNGINLSLVEPLFNVWGSSDGNGGIQEKLLWENDKPTSTFAAQEMGMVLSDYDYIKIKYRASNTLNYVDITEGKIGEQVIMHTVGQASNKIWGAYRTATIKADGIQFSVGTGVTPSAASEMNANIIPLAIYGIKGVQ